MICSKLLVGYPDIIITSRFGERIHPVSGVKKMHNGIDIVATSDGKTGQTAYIRAHTAGVVTESSYDNSRGNYITIKVDDKTQMVYYHLKNKSYFEVGDYVRAGEVIGYTGKTGSATGAHLHFGISYNGKWIDPEPYLNSRWPVICASEPLPVLVKGDKNDYVKKMQNLLMTNKYDVGTSGADGSFGPATTKAILQFKKDTGLVETPDVDYETWAKLINF